MGTVSCLSTASADACTMFSLLHEHTHTHTPPLTGPFSWTTWVSWYQKGKTNLDFTEARDSEWQWHQLGHMQVCILLQSSGTYNVTLQGE